MDAAVSYPYSPAAGQGAYGQTYRGKGNPKRARPRKPRPPRPVPPPPRPVVDPFAPRTNEQIQAQVSAEQMKLLGPIIQEIQRAIEARSQAGQQAIQGYTSQLGGLWSGAAGQTRAAYDQARQAQAGVNTALADRLGGFGQGLSSEIGGMLAGINAPANVQQQFAGGAGLTAQGAANAGFARGSDGLEQLIGQGAAAQGYAAQLPGIAGLTGLQTSKGLQAQLNKELADQLGQARTGAASSSSSLYQHLLDQELEKAIAKQSGLVNKEKLSADRYNKQQTLRYKQQKDKFDRGIKLANLGISQQRVNETARAHGISEKQAAHRLIQQAQNARNVNLRQSRWRVDQQGNIIWRVNKKTGKRERVPIPKPKNKG